MENNNRVFLVSSRRFDKTFLLRHLSEKVKKRHGLYRGPGCKEKKLVVIIDEF